MARNVEEQVQFDAEEVLRANQNPYDPAKHGAGSIPSVGPASVSELHKIVMGLEDRIIRLESMILSPDRSASTESESVVGGHLDEEIPAKSAFSKKK